MISKNCIKLSVDRQPSHPSVIKVTTQKTEISKHEHGDAKAS